LGNSRILVGAETPQEAFDIERILQDDGYTDIHITTDLREIVPLLNVKAFDLLIIDMHSLLIDSALLLHKLPHEVINVKMQTLALVNPGHEPTRLNALVAGACDTLTRPARRKEVIEKVGAILRPPLGSVRL